MSSHLVLVPVTDKNGRKVNRWCRPKVESASAKSVAKSPPPNSAGEPFDPARTTLGEVVSREMLGGEKWVEPGGYVDYFIPGHELGASGSEWGSPFAPQLRVCVGPNGEASGEVDFTIYPVDSNADDDAADELMSWISKNSLEVSEELKERFGVELNIGSDGAVDREMRTLSAYTSCDLDLEDSFADAVKPIVDRISSLWRAEESTTEDLWTSIRRKIDGEQEE